MFPVKLRFGPAGMPLECKGKSLCEGIEYVAKKELNAFEVEFVRGVKGKVDEWKKARKSAEKNDVLLSCHAPYWINCCSPVKEKQEITIRNLLQTARAANILGAYIIVFHPGYYQNLTKEEAMKNAIQLLEKVEKKMKVEKLNTRLGAETTGKISSFGNLHEVIELCKKLENVFPVIDFAHLYARNHGNIKTKDEFNNIITNIKRELGSEYLKQLHCHFSGIEFSDKGEKNHLPISSKKPDFRELAKLLVNKNYKFTIICESPLLDKDAIEMKNIVNKMYHSQI